MSRMLLSFVSLLSANLAFSATYNFDAQQAECVDSKGRVGRNPTLGVCGDQSGQDLSQRNLTAMNLLGSDLSFASLSQVQMDRADLSYTRLSSSSLDQASLRNARLVGAHGENANFDSTTLTSADFRQSRFPFASFVRADLTFALLMNAEFREANFSEAKLKEVVARQIQLGQAQLSKIWAEKADFSASMLKGADLHQAVLRYSNFREADLSEAQIVNADLTGTDLRQSRLFGANFSGSNLKDALVLGAYFDERTQLPFSRSEALALGMIWGGPAKDDLILYDGDAVGFSAGQNWGSTPSDVQEFEKRLRFTLHNKDMWAAAAYAFRNYEEVDLSSYRTLSFQASSSTPVRAMFYLVNMNTGIESESLKPLLDPISRAYSIDLQELQAKGFDLNKTQAIIVAVAEPEEKTYRIDVDDIRVSR
ncbi:MAG TPA: pentapeptide repeat-containing protein [Oligoflexus sp.]|uniref:pentapeptide repeat-containing protein n=1 Tax=Oligoflexus sp. TaxID=1971216 RepID=UPI002D80A947|nr:pentapeptide repeat-containing protein [Oligoflexus sp.]HET9239150.1 pentapeptide repeat-containing protein [Oligoflexus sp.]